MMTSIRAVILLVLIFVGQFVVAQERYWSKPDSLFKFVQPSMSLQFWSLYTMGEMAQFTPGGELEPADDRLSFMVRRARFGFKGKPYPKLNYNVVIQYDNLGKDKLSGARGSTNTGQLGILDVYVTYKLSSSGLFSVTAGFFHPQVSRECITSDLLVTSFDKSYTQSYIRNHITGKGYGRATGLNLGGLKQNRKITIGYNVGIFGNNTTARDPKAFPESSGKKWSPLIAWRTTFSFGDPDMKSYSINYGSNNYFNKRRGITIGVNGSQQNKTDIFDENNALGFDMLFNFNHLNFDAEWVNLGRKTNAGWEEAQTFHIRAGYNIVVMNKVFIEPSFMMTSFESSSEGEDVSYDLGINWYLNKKDCKLSLHYVNQTGKGDNGYTDGTTFRKGDFVGLGLTLIL